MLKSEKVDLSAKKRELFICASGLLISFLFMISISFTTVQAKSLTEIFTTDAFTGSWEVFSNFNWLGKIMNFIISAFSLLGLFLVAYQRLVTMLYLSGKPIFERVHEIKTASKGQKVFGLPFMLKATLNNQYGSGIDSVISFLLSLLPDVKEASDYSDGKRQYNLEDSDSITQYVLKVSIPTIMTIFFFTIGFSGTYFQIYGNIVGAMATVADNFVDTKLSTYMDKLIHKGSAYQFAYDDDGTKVGALRQNIAEDIYTKIIKNIDNPTSDATLMIGQKVDQAVETYFTAEKISAALGAVNSSNESVMKWDGSEATAGNVQYSVTVNARHDSYTGEVEGATLSLTDMACGYDISSSYANGEGYIHVVFNKKSNSVEHNYFATPDEKKVSENNKNLTDPEKKNN